MKYRIVRSSRKTIALQITPDGDILVRCPNRMGTDAVQRFIDSKTGWIEMQLSRLAARPRLPAFTDAELRALIQQARKHIPGRAAYFAPKVGVTYNRITIRSQRSRWGSCSNKGNLNLNCLLMLTPPEVLDYMVVHELCHRKALNHSPRFWAEVARILPDYKLHQKWLKEEGAALIARLK